MLNSEKKTYSPSVARFLERLGGAPGDTIYNSQDILGHVLGRRSFTAGNQRQSFLQSYSPTLTRGETVRQKLRRSSVPSNQNFKTGDDPLRNATKPINNKRLTFLQTSEVAGNQGENFCCVEEVPVRTEDDAIRDESFTSEPSFNNGVKTYMCIVCGELLFLANKRLGMYDLVSLTFSKPIRTFKQSKGLLTSFSTSLYSQTEKRHGHVKFQCSNCNVNVGHIHDRKPIPHSLFKTKEDFVDRSAENVKYCEQLEARNFVLIR